MVLSVCVVASVSYPAPPMYIQCLLFDKKSFALSVTNTNGTIDTKYSVFIWICSIFVFYCLNRIWRYWNQAVNSIYVIVGYIYDQFVHFSYSSVSMQFLRKVGFYKKMYLSMYICPLFIATSTLLIHSIVFIYGDKWRSQCNGLTSFSLSGHHQTNHPQRPSSEAHILCY